MNRYVAMLIALAALVASGLVHGFWAERWTVRAALEEAAVRVDKVPLEIGDWKAQTLDADPGVFAQAGARNYWTRLYVHATKKTTLLVILMCGRAGRMAVHTPEVCYRGAGYEMGGKAETWTVKSPLGEDLGTFWTSRFLKGTGAGPAIGAGDVRLYWSWNPGGSWQAPVNPRWEFGGGPFLYKLYVSYEALQSGDTSAKVVQDFFRQFLPELHKTLVTPVP